MRQPEGKKNTQNSKVQDMCLNEQEVKDLQNEIRTQIPCLWYAHSLWKTLKATTKSFCLLKTQDENLVQLKVLKKICLPKELILIIIKNDDYLLSTGWVVRY